MKRSPDAMIRRFTAAEVLRMMEAGILAEDEPVELLDGELVIVTPQGPRHAALTDLIARRMEAAFGRTHHARRHSPLNVSDDCWPEPDVALVRGDDEDYLDGHPHGADTLLVVEVAQTTQERDRLKAELYARAGVPVYWLVDLEADRVEVRTSPSAEGGYADLAVFGRGEELPVPGLDRRIPVNDLLGG